MRYAHYTPGLLVISTTPSPATETDRFPVSGIRQARAICREINATPWNF